MLCLAMTIFSFLCLLRISDINFYSHITLAKSFFSILWLIFYSIIKVFVFTSFIS